MQLQKLSRCEACFLQPAGLAVYGRHQAPVGEIRALPLAARGIGGLLVLHLPQECERKGEAGSDGYAPIQADGLANEADPSLKTAGNDVTHPNFNEDKGLVRSPRDGAVLHPTTR